MIPSNLALLVGVVQKYNNNIVIADDSREIGENEDINPMDSAAAAVKPVDSEAAVNPRDSAEAAKPVHSATPLDSAPEQLSTRISRAEIGAGIALWCLFCF